MKIIKKILGVIVWPFVVIGMICIMIFVGIFMRQEHSRTPMESGNDDKKPNS